MEINSFNPLQVHCPECQKLFFVRTEDLHAGQARFQCTSCKGIFAFNWPQPPGISSIRAQIVDPADFKPVDLPTAEASVNTVQNKVTKSCPQCGEKVDTKRAECPKCGIIFDRIRRLKTLEPVMPPAGEEVVAMWEAVKTHYDDEKRHERFIQLCLSRNNLPFASSQYRTILLANPTEEIANRMQNRIVELATMTYIATQSNLRKPLNKSWRMSGFVLFIGLVLVVAGALTPQARSLIAVGCSLLAFVVILRQKIFNDE